MNRPRQRLSGVSTRHREGEWTSPPGCPQRSQRRRERWLITVGRGRCQRRGRGGFCSLHSGAPSTGKRSSPWPEFPRAITDLKILTLPALHPAPHNKEEEFKIQTKLEKERENSHTDVWGWIKDEEIVCSGLSSDLGVKIGCGKRCEGKE